MSSDVAPAPAHDSTWQPGEPGAGGYHALFKAPPEEAATIERIGVQYANMQHQSETAVNGMWLFLCTELLFFGGLFLLYFIYRSLDPLGFAEGSRHSEWWIGTPNTVLLLTSSAVFAFGLSRARLGDNRGLFWCTVVTAVLGVAFLVLKVIEWKDDLDEHLFPGPDFAIHGPHSGGAQLFWSYYFIGTVLHGIHMVFGIGLVAWIAHGARRGRFSPGYVTPVEGVGLYWSFVDMVWVVLFSTIYLVGGIGQ